MSQFKEYKNLNLIDVAENVAEFWKANKTFEKSVETREGNPEFVFYEGPPSANGMPGIHHVMARALKDIFCRYQTQNGKQVFRKAGWDTHGLPVELGVEKELGITKEDIGKKISIEDYNKACREAVMRYTDVWNHLTEKIGYWVDLEDPYITYKSKYMETVWWLLKQLYSKDLLYKGYTIQPYSPKAGTGLSSHEVNQPGAYRDVTDTTIVAQFKTLSETLPVFLQGFGDVHFLAWTTTPWTLPSNTALTVGPKIDYVLVKTFNQYTFEPVNIVLAKPLVGKQFGKKFVEGTDEDFANYTSSSKTIPFQILGEFKGSDLVGIKYEQLLPYALPYQNPENAFRVISGDFVTTEDGTGIVHTAPTFGADDAKVAKEAKPEVPPMLVLNEFGNPVPLVDLQGKFTSHMGDFAGKYVKNEYYDAGTAPEKSVDVEIAIRLKEENKAFKVEKYVHSYPHSWRTDEPLLYYPLDSWFVKMTAVKDRLVDLNKEINWKPKSTGEGRFGNWLENVNDWNLSRSRYWGIPLPIWRTDPSTGSAQEEIIIGSVEELYNEIEKSIAAGLMKENPFKGFEIGNMSEENYSLVDLHKNIVDKIVLVSESGKAMNRESDLIDVWFDSGSMPYAQLHYPFENKELIDNNKAFPADFIAEGVDQTRGWFYTLHAIGTAVFDSVAYKNVMSNGLVLDKNGLKMSKSKGNAVDPFETLAVYGPDATRWYMVSNANPWENLKFDIEGIDEVRRKFFGTLYNTYSFFTLYANVDGFKYAEKDIENRPEIDRWILSELNLLIKEVKAFYEDYEPTRVARSISTFVNDNLSNWYVRLCRRRFWKGDYSDDKISAYQTLYTCLETVAKLSAPIAPFFMDQLYQDLNAATGKETFESVHLTDFPVADESLIDQDLVEKTHLAQSITSMVFSLRKKENVKVRQPLQKVLIPVLDKKTEEQILAVSELIKQEVNVKELQLINAEEASHLIVKQIKPNFKTLGSRLGKDMKVVGNEIANLTSEKISSLEKEGSLEIQGYEITTADVEISTKDIPGWTVTSDGKTTVALDLKITDELKSEGIAREFINRIQNLRKEKDFELTDRISIILEENSPFLDQIKQNEDYISSEVLSNTIEIVPSLSSFNEIDIDDINFKVNVEKN
ncbi:isoleucine--tRNA ligase [Chryseobacterium wangxinyae]|uniref:isoleucine--tRNA ligase n=1 Tax=unclassified Chryseobacterium TaxID=2593645 RepID=UPI002270BDB7|nr:MULTISPECIES: isoleucine--tRNA ligase [unclassified Chryseobacterium]MCY0969834.1 isoleucine--tRNA ligase [Chryseobacterium sp. CY353]MCY0976301.1 isoleucine--tRNA ligase [Chryseobacterium sp. CY350]WBZ94101.1 isoleucine--tRNA ligase [Chryseobacterium sp. CY350]